ncbi:MAG: guanylate kinase [Firmicutes bacterium]|nr:guanylate kinase [Bacillota bacterium]
MAQGKLFVISGPSGVGKGTICKRILETDPKARFSVSMTTRQPREGEVEAVDYFFVSRDRFEELLGKGGLLEYNVYNETYYGTPKAPVVQWIEEGCNVILEIDYHGAFQVRDAYPEAVLIFIMPPSIEELETRITGRGSESEESKKYRLAEALGEIAQAEQYDYIIVNDDLDAAVARVSEIMNKED